MKVTWATLALTLLLALLGNVVNRSPLEAQIYDFSRIEINVEQLGEELQFKFFLLREDPKAEQRIPARLYRMTVFEPIDKRVLWQIETSNIESMTTSVRYGIVPDGFKQILPQAGSAPNLEAGRRYSIWAYCEANGIGMSSFTTN